MKLSKSLVATVLVLCMLLATMPVMGAVLQEPITELYVPAEGMNLTTGNTGVNGQHWKIVINSSSVTELGISHSYASETWVNSNGALTGSAYDGLVLSGTTKMSATDLANAVDGAVVEFTFNKAPLSRVSYRPGNAMSFCIDFAELATGKYISNVKIWDAEKGEAVDYDGRQLTKTSFMYNGSSYCGYSKPTNFRVDRGTWTGYHPIDTGVFPENTIFITDINMTARENSSASIEKTTIGKYHYRYSSNGTASTGEFGVYVPEVSGTYYAYGLRGYHSNGGSRDSKVSIHTSLVGADNKVVVSSAVSAFTGANGVDTSKIGHSAFWCADANATQYKLTKGVPFMVVREHGGTYDRFIALALVPAKADGTNPMLDVTDSTWTYANLPSQENLLRMENLTAGQVKGEDVTVTVNGVETIVPATAARIKDYGYLSTLPAISKVDLKGHAISEATVFDALVTATSPVEGNEEGYVPYNTATDGIAKGGLTTKYAVEVNGKTCLNIDQTLIKDGDVIETKAFTIDNFNPQVAGMVANNPRLVSGLAYSGTNVLHAFDTAKLTELGLMQDGDYTDIDGCMLTGYIYPRNTSRWQGVAPNLDYNKSKIYYDGVRLMYRVPTGNLSAGYYLPIAEDRHKLTHTERLDDVMLENGTLHHPYKVTSAAGSMAYDYFGENLWFVNTQTTNKVALDMDEESGRFVLSTDGAKLLTIFVITYDENGAITKKEMKKETYICWDKPYVGEIAENQTVYVWDTKALEGTNMKPLMQPISK